MKVRDFLNWLKENNVDEDSEIDIARDLGEGFATYGNFFENDLSYDKDLETVEIWAG